MKRLITLPLALAMLAGCERSPSLPEFAGPGSGGPSFAVHSASAPVVNSTADPGDGTCDETECTLREAIDFASSGATITFSVSGPITLGSTLIITRDLSITGPAGGLTIRRDPANPSEFRIFHISSGNVRLANLTITGGKESSSFGGGIQNDATLTLTNSTVSGNSAAGGGGVYNFGGDLTVSRSTIAGNSAVENPAAGIFGSGGGINNFFGALRLTNSTISGNSADNLGGGISSHFTPVEVTNSTITRNAARGRGGGIDNNWYITLRNALVAGNSARTAGPDLYNRGFANVTASFTLIGDGSESRLTHGESSNQVGTNSAPIDPKLGPLEFNGGPTQTHKLRPGSPAIEKGTLDGCPATDQIGVVRPQGLTCDIGSVERKGAVRPGG